MVSFHNDFYSDLGKNSLPIRNFGLTGWLVGWFGFVAQVHWKLPVHLHLNCRLGSTVA